MVQDIQSVFQLLENRHLESSEMVLDSHMWVAEVRHAACPWL